ncbi:MAG: Y-family DNA polymerase [Oscillatoriales cyanobacterium SM2_2_1]|nr:Y-family DNA polymerase [Oscillatoriales cyanobacterium SM2_2_1]
MTLFAIVDGNHFYVSCERVFQPQLEGLPVVVSNGFCVLSKSPETKPYDIAIGTPMFKLESLVKRGKIQVCPTNFRLYGDLSRRMMQVLADFAPLEVASIDEAFLDVSFLADGDGRWVDWGQSVQQRVRQWLGLPVAVGIGPTKTLAKVANRWAKRFGQGVMQMMHGPSQEALLAEFPVSDVWGVGRRLAPKLAAAGIHTALALRDADEDLIRGRFGGRAAQALRELRGIVCFPLVSVAPPPQQASVFRTFAEPLVSLADLQRAIADYVALGAERLRKHHLAATELTVSVRSHRLVPAQATTRYLPLPTNYTPELISHATEAITTLFRHGESYKKIGVVLTGLRSCRLQQGELFAPVSSERQSQLMAAYDGINQKFGSGAVRFGRMTPQTPNLWLSLPTVR